MTNRFESCFSTKRYHPFFRGHAHHDAKRREPYVFGEPHTERMRQAIISRYQLLPLWYTLFYKSHVSGAPVMRALWMHYPEDESVIGMAVGEEKSFTLTPEKGYGEYFEERVSEMPKENIPAHFLNQLGPGSIVPLMSKDGTSRVIATIVEIKDESILVDMNHPLAGKTLNFDVEVVSITEETDTTESTETLDSEATMDASDE